MTAAVKVREWFAAEPDSLRRQATNRAMREEQ